MIYGMELLDRGLEEMYGKNADRLFVPFKGIH
jgi:hypothetical protein